PRRLLPNQLAEPFFSGQLTPHDALKRWILLAEQSNTSPVVIENLKNLRTLATSIERQGLINPISIRPNPGAAVPEGVEYLVVTGERRWWAHMLLSMENRPIQEGNKSISPTQIKATQTAEGVAIRAHQLIENIMREDIGLIEKADGILALRDELTAIAHEGLPGEATPVTWGEVDEVLGISRQYRSRIMKVLDLNQEAQQLVDSYGLTERAIRPIAQKLVEYPELQIKALHQLIAWQEEDESGNSSGRRITASTNQYVEQLLQEMQSPQPTDKAKRKPAVARSEVQKVNEFRSKIRHTLGFVDKLDRQTLQDLGETIQNKADYADVVADLRALRQKIDEILR
ncbi:MAG: ParB N-terminal domain-containing protein, partial [Anaerolineales bacterium]|nr:ParB N-terminal domain-containing protein [Anaerolineales bacterium]